MSTQHDFHPGGKKTLQTLVEDFQLTMQHALRQDLRTALESRAQQDAGVLPPLTAAEMFDYLAETDSEFYNWCFPACAFVLTAENMGAMHSIILQNFRVSLQPEAANPTDGVEGGGDRP